MKYMYFGFICMLLGAITLAGCGLTSDQQKRVDALVAENEALYQKERQLAEDAKNGKVTAAQVAGAVVEITTQMKKNLEEIKAIKDAGNSTAAIIGAIAGTLGRSALHAAAGMIPGGNPLLGGLQGLLTLLLGGSETKKSEVEDKPATA